MPYYNKQRNTWMGQVKSQGKIVARESFKTKKEAIEFEVNERKLLKSVKINTVSLVDWSTKYLEHVETNQSEQEFDYKFKTMSQFFKFHKDELKPEDPIEKVIPIHITTFMDDVVKHRSGGAANNCRKHLSAAWTFAEKQLGVTHPNPCTHIKKRAQLTKEKPIPTMDDFWKVIHCCYCPQDERLLKTYLYTGARRDEIFRLKWEDVDFKKQVLKLWYRKNDKGQWLSRTIKFIPELNEILEKQYIMTSKFEHVFINESKGKHYGTRFIERNGFMKRMCEFANVPHFNFGSFRPMVASLLLDKGMKLSHIQQLLGHAKISTTIDYYIRTFGINPEEDQDFNVMDVLSEKIVTETKETGDILSEMLEKLNLLAAQQQAQQKEKAPTGRAVSA